MEKLRNFFRHLFIPAEHNNFRARSLHTDFLTFYLVIAFLISIAFKQISYSNVLGFATDISVDKLYQLTNQEREKSDLTDLKYNQELANAAYAKAEDMFAKNYWAHFAPDGKSPWDFILNSGYKYEYAGENLAKNFLFSDGVVTAWMNSPSHRENLLKPQYTDVGFAVVNGILDGEQTTLVVQMFGKPLTSSVTQQPNVAPPPQVVLQPEVKTVEQPKTIPNNNKQLILTKNNQTGFLNFSALAFNMNVVFFGFLLLALALDFYFAAKLNVVRISGKNLAHFIFIFFILVGLIFITRGAII